MTGAALLVYSILTTVRDTLPAEMQEKYQLNIFLHHWSWQTWIAVFSVGNFLIVLHGAWLAIKKRDRDNANLKAQIETVEKAKPRIRLRSQNPIQIKKVWQKWGNQTFTDVPFLNMWFENDPPVSNQTAIANDVRAKISYFRCPGNEHILSIDGRWADSSQPPALNPLASWTPLLPVTFGISETHELDIAYRASQTGQAYAWNNDNYRHEGYLRQENLLGTGKFRVEVRLRGVSVDELFSFTFETAEDGFLIEE